MTVHIESPLGFTADFPDHTLVLEDSTAGPNSEQYGLLGDVLVTVIKDDTSVEGPAQANGWAHLMSGRRQPADRGLAEPSRQSRVRRRCRLRRCPR